ncbi:MAG: stage III sporulation protein AB, partial [Clostridia bacterium]|nr:stage III sporulation protein AB [Clostridia bacterium]
EALKGAINLISTEIRYFASPVDVIMKKLNALDEYKELKIFGLCETLLKTTNNFATAWSASIAAAKPQLSLNKGDYEALLWFGSMLGATDIEGQIANCERYSEMLSQRLVRAREDKSKRGKMYSSLGFLSGAFFIVVFL